MSTELESLAQPRPPEQRQQPSMHQVVQRMLPEIQRALPRHLSGDRMARLALTAIRKDETLAKSTPESFAGALLAAAALGLEVGVNGEAYLVAYTDRKTGVTDASLIVGYQGYAKLFWQHPMAAMLDAQAVYSNDEFDYRLGTEPYLTHKPATGKRGTVVAYYAVAGLTNGATPFVVLSPDEVKALRGGKVGSRGGIPDPQHWMERKTVLRQLFKLTPKSTALVTAIESDERSGAELHAEQVSAREAEQAIPPSQMSRAIAAPSDEQIPDPSDGDDPWRQS